MDFEKTKHNNYYANIDIPIFCFVVVRKTLATTYASGVVPGDSLEPSFVLHLVNINPYIIIITKYYCFP